MKSAVPAGDAGPTVWRGDVAVVGGGPAGAVSAYLLARRGLRVLLVEAATQPRWKVCGGCLSPGAQAALERVGLGDVPRRAGAVPLHTLRLAGWGVTVDLRLHGTVAVSRARLDALLLQAAEAAGAEIRAPARASFPGGAAFPEADGTRERPGAAGRHIAPEGPGGPIRLRLRDPGGVPRDRDPEGLGDPPAPDARLGDPTPAATPREDLAEASVVVAADGLAGGILRRWAGPDAAGRPQPGARMGFGALLPASATAAAYPPGVIHMALGPGGYVGVVRLGDGTLDVAAALDVPPGNAGSAGLERAVATLLAGAGFPPLPGPPLEGWRGTPRLTRRAHPPGAPGVFAVGDAAGYVEPFTGEGIAWALAGAEALAPIAAEAAAGWHPDHLKRWTRVHHRRVWTHAGLSRRLARVLRRRHAARAALRLLSLAPGLAAPWVRRASGLTPHVRKRVR